MEHQDPLSPELALVAALKLTAPPAEWVERAALIPTVVAGLQRALGDPAFRSAFAFDATAAVRRAGFEPTPALIGALRERLHG